MLGILGEESEVKGQAGACVGLVGVRMTSSVKGDLGAVDFLDEEEKSLVRLFLVFNGFNGGELLVEPAYV